eukprot:6071663-Pleurochrysis_carterae.AAC.1
MVVYHIYLQPCLSEKGSYPVWTVEGSREEEENGPGSESRPGGWSRVSVTAAATGRLEEVGVACFQGNAFSSK